MSYSVIIPTVKEEVFMQCVDGITSKYPIEVIVRNVKTRSTKIEQICKDKGWKYSYCDDESLAASINYGFRIAKYDYLMQIQDDVILTEGQMDFLFEKYKEKEGMIALLAPEYTTKLDPDYSHEILTNSRRHDWFMFIISRKEFEEIGSFDTYFYPYYFEDSEFHNRLNHKGFQAGILTTLVVNHLISQSIDKEVVRVTSDINERYYRKRVITIL